MPLPLLLTADEAAALLRTTRRAIYIMAERHQLPGVAKRQLCVRQSDWNGQLGTPKSGRLRYVPLTRRLTATLVDHRHLRSKRVVCQTDGAPFTRQIVQNRMNLAAKRANVRRGVHILRHTFCSHLSMRGPRRERSRSWRVMRIWR